jgi:hypothetical protein
VSRASLCVSQVGELETYENILCDHSDTVQGLPTNIMTKSVDGTFSEIAKLLPDKPKMGTYLSHTCLFVTLSAVGMGNYHFR